MVQFFKKKATAIRHEVKFDSKEVQDRYDKHCKDIHAVSGSEGYNLLRGLLGAYRDLELLQFMNLDVLKKSEAEIAYTKGKNEGLTVFLSALDHKIAEAKRKEILELQKDEDKKDKKRKRLKNKRSVLNAGSII